MKKAAILLIVCYQKSISPDTGVLRMLLPDMPRVCTMYPTCSEYTKTAILKYGVLQGFFKGSRRILRCHPYQKTLVDIP